LVRGSGDKRGPRKTPQGPARLRRTQRRNRSKVTARSHRSNSLTTIYIGATGGIFSPKENFFCADKLIGKGDAMTYYEELGVSEIASREEIEQAYNHLSDRQKQRLDGKVDVLLDAESRRRYDRSLISLAAALANKHEFVPKPPSVWLPLAPAGIAVVSAV